MIEIESYPILSYPIRFCVYPYLRLSAIRSIVKIVYPILSYPILSYQVHLLSAIRYRAYRVSYPIMRLSCTFGSSRGISPRLKKTPDCSECFYFRFNSNLAFHMKGRILLERIKLAKVKYKKDGQGYMYLF